MPRFWNVSPRADLHGYQLIVAKGQLYCVGGFWTRVASSLVEVNFFYRYDTESNRWKELEFMKMGRGCCVTIVLGDYIYAIGGWSFNNHASIAEVERFNLNTGKWELVAPLPEFSTEIMLSGMGVVFRDRIVVHCVERQRIGYQGHLMWYDDVSNKWYKLISYNIPDLFQVRSLEGPCVVVHEDALYIVVYKENGVARVQQVIVREGEQGMPIWQAKIKEPQDVTRQEELRKQGLSAFCIGEQLFANLNGNPFKLQPWILQQSACSPKKTVRNLTEQLEKDVCFAEFDLDRYSLMSNGS